MTRPSQLLWIFAAVCVASAPAHAQPTKVALAIDGDSSSIGLRKAVVGAFDDDSNLEFVSAKKTTQVIEKLGIGEVASAKDAKTVAAKLDVNAVVQGTFDESAGTVKFTIYTKGKRSSITMVVDDWKSEKFRKAVRKKMLAKISVAATDDESEASEPAKPAKKSEDKTAKSSKKKHAEEAADEEAVDEKPVKRKKHAESATDEKVARSKTKNEAAEKDKDSVADKAKDKPAKSKKHADESDSDETADSEADADEKHDRKAHKDHADHAATSVASDDNEDAPADDADESAHVHVDAPAEASSAPGVNLAAIRLDLGGSMMGRSLKFTSTLAQGAPSSYRSKPVPGGHLAVELYPGAFSDRTSFVAGFGIAADFDQATSVTAPASDGTTPLKVTERSYSFGARYRLALGHRATSPTLTAGVGYGARTFAVDHSTGMTTDLPDVDYRMIDPGLTARIPIGRRVAVTASGRGLLLTAAGPIANADQYGRAHVVGGSATAGLEVVINNHLALRVAGEATQFDLKFYGAGMQATSRDGDPSTVDVQKAVDRYYGAEAMLALLY